MALLMACQKVPSGPPSAAAPEERLEPRIRAFVERATSGQRDGAGSMSADSAEWYVEAALNYSNADLTIEYNDAEVDSITYTIPLENGMADEADAIAAYNALNPVVATSNDEGISHVVIVDVTSQNTADELILTAAVVVGSGYEKSINASYGPNDWWMWMGNGNCNCKNPPLNPPPANNNLCADKRIQARMIQAINNGQYVYMVSIETWLIWTYNDIPNKIRAYSDFPAPIGPDNPVSGDWIRDYRTYACQGGTACSTCLSPTDMSFHTLGTWDLMGIIRQQHCPTKIPQGATVQGELAFSNPSLYFHSVQYRYGVIPK